MRQADMKRNHLIYSVVRSLLSVVGGAVIALFFHAPAQAQELLLDENCTISILNRTAQVQPDGSWRIDNVPANFGAVRARATCVEGGVTLSGQSGLFNVEEGIVNGFDAEIVLGSATPIPVSLAMSAPVSTLTSAGATAQLGVTATFPDGGTAEVSAAANGTNYTVSNPGVATVGADGLVTAVLSGTVTVSAMLEGADGDGLTNKAELVDFGTDFLLADTDGDGIEDGEEVN